MDNKDIHNNLNDKIKKVIDENFIQYTSFLGMNKQSIVLEYLKKINFTNYILYGGDEDLDRKILFLLPDYYNEDDFYELKLYNDYMSIIRIKLPRGYKLYHKDYLGVLMSLGIKREVIGDIVISKNSCDIVVKKNMVDYISENITKIGNVGVSVEKLPVEELMLNKLDLHEMNINVASNRLDNFVSSIYKISRNKAQELIEMGLVLVNGLIIYKSTSIINIGDTIIVRKLGKSKIASYVSNTRKDRLVYKVLLYK